MCIRVIREHVDVIEIGRICSKGLDSMPQSVLLRKRKEGKDKICRKLKKKKNKRYLLWMIM